MDEPALTPSRRKQWVWLLLVPSAAILLIPCLCLLIPTENLVAMKLQSQGYDILYNIFDDMWVWHRPTHFSNRQDFTGTGGKGKPGYEVNNQILVELQKMPRLQHIIFSDTDLSHLDLELLTKVPSLGSFSIINNCNPAWSPKEIEKLSGCKQLRFLSLMNSPLTGKEIEPLKACPIVQLRCTLCDLTDADVAVFTLFPMLGSLDLGDNPGITDASLDVLATIPTLQLLFIYNTGVTEAGIEVFQKKRPDVSLMH